MKKQCDLCKRRPASMHCDSDQASLCFQCDGSVHAANFLVARHARTLLCHACYAPTPWTASGDKLGSVVSFCHRCSSAGAKVDEREIVDFEEDVYEDDDEEEEEEEGEEEEEDGDNQVVPWSAVLPAEPSSSSNSEDDSRRHSSDNSVRSSAKRSRETQEVAAGLISASLRSNSVADGDETTSIGISRHKKPFLHRPNMRNFSGDRRPI